MTTRRTALALGAALAAALLPAATPALAQGSATSQTTSQTLRIGLREDPDILDPTLARTFVGRIVFASLCDKLFDINDKLEIVPQLATGYSWEDPKTLRITLRPGVLFHDGEKMDAEAVRYSLNRHLSLQGSFRRSEINAMDSVEVVDPLTLRIRLKAPSSPFVSQLTDRAGMIVSPKAAEAAGRDFGNRPVCAGPYRFVERVAQDRIVVEKFPGYWDAASIRINRITYLPIADSSVRLANLQSGALDVVEVAPSDLATLKANRRLRTVIREDLGYQSIIYNVGNGPRAETPFGRDPRVRAAFELAIDRDALNQVVFEGLVTPTAQAVPPASPYHDPGFRPEPRNLERARALLKEAGVATPVVVEMTVPTNPELRQAAEVMQAMVKEAGFDLRIASMEFASSLQAAQRGDFQTYLSAWSGRVDPDGNTWAFLHSKGAQNDGKSANPEVDRLLDAAREETDGAKRRALYAQVWQIALRQDRARVYLWHRAIVMGYSARLQNFTLLPDGLIRPQGLALN
ncbi:ABC transporter substrate-binding protein [Roseomonas sp. GC11]|uniref:ABC transporter substrate-binding protein n=1 Tax=Roseomonas sp. GC11 TaxID=2950546 RepID=UPI00210D1D1A|nr:ABC transporter substrate-binding protein [Roseomonas sp. GC11]MCQ4162229.1 ABC transporter substrate-binding protein [Roseomonas sp. GC11]